MRRIEIVAFATAALAVASPAMGQGRGRTNNGVPPGQLPPAGMCRVWIDGIPPGREPPVTDCATAQLQRPLNSRVIYGDATPRPGIGRHRNSSNGNVVTIGGRQCIERTDRAGNVRYECPNDTYDRNGGGVYNPNGTYNPNAVYRRNGTYDQNGALNGRRRVDDRGRVISQDRDGDEDGGVLRGNSGQRGQRARHGRGHDDRGDDDRG